MTRCRVQLIDPRERYLERNEGALAAAFRGADAIAVIVVIAMVVITGIIWWLGW